MSVADKIRAAVAAVAARQAALPDPSKAKRLVEATPPKPVVDVGYSSAVAGMVDTEFIKTKRYQEQQYRAYSLGAHPVIVEFSTLLVRRMRDKGIPMFPHCIWRDKDEQDRVFRESFSQTQWPNSAHNHGCATDIIHSTKAWDLTPRQWQVVGHVGKELAASKGWKLVWGGLDSPGDKFGWDPAHWELANWREHKRTLPDPKPHQARLY